MSNITEQKSP